MQRLAFIVCLLSVASAQIDPRGARPVEHGTRSEKCATEKEWPFCTDDEWGPKCPSGCRIQGLMDKFDHTTVKKIEQIRGLLDKNKASHRSADEGSKQTYDYLRDRLTLESGNNNNYYGLALNLRQRITNMKIKIDTQIRLLAALKDRVKDQVIEMQRLEVDIDIKLRSCKGSCASYSEHQVDQDSYVTLDKQINQLDSQFAQNTVSVGSLYVMKSKPLKDVTVDSIYKSSHIVTGAAAQTKDDDLPEVPRLILEAEGSTSSPATVSKDPVCLRLNRQNQDGRQSIRRQQCGATPDVPMCSDDDWISKCPSGCRLQGLIQQTGDTVDRKLWTVCRAAKTMEDATEKSMKAAASVYSSQRLLVVSRYMSELKFTKLAEDLSGNVTTLRKRSTQLSRQLEELSVDVRKQIEDLYRAEVDIDMKLRSCHGSCRSVPPFKVDHSSYETLRADMDETLGRRNKATRPPEDVPHIKLQPVDAGVASSAGYKSIPTVERELLTPFKDIEQNRLTMEKGLNAAELE
uniref:Fibrinogen alpha chain n=1 Tax=Acanthochromis polyacanthus TaxID=80966 RepID=A0A3Q1F3U9_9TELE